MKKSRIALPEIGQNVENYTQALKAADLEPVVISVQACQTEKGLQQEYLDYSQFQAENYDGLLLPGGVDIHPGRYGQENHGSVGIVEALDALQLDVLAAFVKERKPVLGICRGLQLINVFFGGTLIQDLPCSVIHSKKPGEKDKAHPCIAHDGSWIAGLYGQEFCHNSAHHQAVDRLGEGLIADSNCPLDGTIEALHHEKLPVYAVQWHP